jgi:hypothetical protein
MSSANDLERRVLRNAGAQRQIITLATTAACRATLLLFIVE